MTARLVAVAQYLTYAEAIGLYQALAAEEILSIVKSCGPPSLPFGEGLYFQLLIKEADQTAGEAVLKEFSEKQAENGAESPTCPACGSVYVGPEANLPFWKKLLYAGTTVFKCQNCQRSFFA